MKRVAAAFAVTTAVASCPGLAGDLDNLRLLDQGEFRLLSEDLGAALSYKPVSPTEPLGFPGFDVGIAITGTRLQNTDVFRKASSTGDFPSTLPVPTVRGIAGLPYGFDVGVSASAVPGTDIRLYGGEIKWAFIPGSTTIPAIGIRGSYSRLNGVDQLDFRAKGIDLSISKGILFATPYAGVGRVWIDSTPNGAPGLEKASFSLPKLFLGVNANFGLVNFAFEWDRTGEADSIGAKVGFRF
jgi:hypothetical protein